MGDGGRILPPGERSHYAIIGGARAATAQESPACRGSKPKGDGGDGCSEWGEEQARGGQGGLRGRDGPGLGWGEAGTERRGDGGQGRNGPPSDGSDQR